jgi:hypothetical protein
MKNFLSKSRIGQNWLELMLWVLKIAPKPRLGVTVVLKVHIQSSRKNQIPS